MNSQLVIDLMHQRLLPLIADGNYRLLPSAEREILHDKSFQPIFPYTVQSHSYFEWVWCVENHSYLKIQDKVFRLEAGDFCLLPPGEIHADVYIPSLTPYKVIWSSYHRNRIESSYHVYTPINHLQLQAQVCAASPPSMTSLLGMLMQELMILNAHREPICKGLVLALTHLMLRSFKSSIENEAAQGAGELSARVDEYLHKHFNKRISLNDVARALHFSRNYLAALYKQETQKTIGQMLTEIRLRHAKQLLLETHLTVREIAISVGYASPEHFSRIFFKHEGTTPGSYGK
jgi:AraC-like DNA-binding protein